MGPILAMWLEQVITILQASVPYVTKGEGNGHQAVVKIKFMNAKHRFSPDFSTLQKSPVICALFHLLSENL